jgi:hypothetical protein
VSYYDALRVKDFAATIKHGFDMARAGQSFNISWAGQEITNLDAFHKWFQDNVDKRINHKSGLRTDGAPRKTRCHCRHCMGTCTCAIKKITVDGRDRCGYGCRAPWGGRKWESDYEREAHRVAYMVSQPRRLIRVTEVPPEFRARFAHRISEEM